MDTTKDLNQFTSMIQEHNFPFPWYGHLIAGERRLVDASVGDKAESRNPSNDDTIQEFYNDRSSIQDAMRAAKEYLAKSDYLPIKKRFQYLQNLSEHLIPLQDSFAELMRFEIGKPSWEAKHESDVAIKDLRLMLRDGEGLFEKLLSPATIGHTKGDFNLVPVGCVAAYIPFSTPLSSMIHYVASAISGGSPIILFTSNHCTALASLFTFVLEKCDLPKGLVQVIFGGFKCFRQVLSESSIRAILYTGSREHCEEIRQASNRFSDRRLILQSGGKNTTIVHSSADAKFAARNIAYGAFRSAGQLCTSTSRVIANRQKLEELTQELAKIINDMKIGPTHLSESADGPLMGPLYSEKSVERFLRFQTMANREATENVVWGKAVNIRDHKGHYVRPGLHFYEEYDANSTFQNSVLFCPDICLYPYDELDKAFKIANSTDTAFALSFIGDGDIIEKRRNRLKAPNILVNLPTTEVEANLPLAGRYSSASNRFHGVSLALYLSNPQALQQEKELQEVVEKWPW